MKVFKQKDMKKGWFVGDFLPTAYKTKNCEIGVKGYKKGDKEEEHYHKIATEITMIVIGMVKMCDKLFWSGDIIVLEPGEVTSFEAISDAITVVVKIPGALNDKYLKEKN